MPDITFDIIKTYGLIAEERGGWRKELNLVSWNGRNPKFDIRDWSPDHEKMGKGITLSQEEAAILTDLLKQAMDQVQGDENKTEG
ncbi:MAG: hypothetical protein LBT39_08930 [Treponema sp.]|jgi:hypothetical protein|nr:hypothetical protein [Treponema sp.]